MSLAALRTSSKGLLNKIKESNTTTTTNNSRAVDERIWKPTFDKEKGTGTATIRFMPACPAEVNELPYIKVHSHSFQGPTGKWYIEKSLSTIGKVDPVGDLNRRLWNSGIESDKEICRNQKRKTTYFANVLILKDPAHPELEGKVMIYEYGAKIAKMLHEAAFPTAEFEGEDPPEELNAFDVFEGADFTIRMVGHKMKDSQGREIVVPNYDKSSFKDRAPLYGGDEAKIEAVWNKCHPLQPLIASDKFKSAEALQSRLVEVLGPYVGSGVPTVGGAIHTSAGEDDDQPAAPAPAPKRQPRATTTATPAAAPAKTAEAEDEDAFAFLRELED